MLGSTKERPLSANYHAQRYSELFLFVCKQPPHLEETNQIEVLDKEEAQPFVEGQLVKIRKTSEEETKRRWHNEWDLLGGVKGMKSYPSVTIKIDDAMLHAGFYGMAVHPSQFSLKMVGYENGKPMVKYFVFFGT